MNNITRTSTTELIMELTKRIESAKAYDEQTGREQALERDLTVKSSQAEAWRKEYEKTKKEANELRDKVQGQYDDIVMLEREVEVYTKKYNELAQQKEASSGPCGCQTYRDLEEKIATLEHDLTAKTAQAEAWKKKYYDFKEALVRAGDPRVVEGVSGVIMNKPTMPVIPKDVAIAIFREGVACGVSSACDEIDNDAGISIEETGYTGDFEVSFSKHIDLSEHLDLDWMRDKVGDYDEASVIEALKTLCADNKFECRIHGIDDKES